MCKYIPVYIDYKNIFVGNGSYIPYVILTGYKNISAMRIFLLLLTMFL